MGRLVDAKPIGVRAFNPGDSNRKDEIQDYLTRIAKYVPSEIIAAYLTGLSMISGAALSESLRNILLGALLGGCFIFTPFYLKLMAEAGQPKRLHMCIGSVAFLIWAYSIGGLFTALGWYIPVVAGLLLLLFSLASGLLAPTTGDR